MFDISSHIYHDITIYHDNTYKAILYYDNSTRITKSWSGFSSYGISIISIVW